MTLNDNTNIAILIPCYNEEQTIGIVIDQFKAILPTAKVYVYDNNSKDNTSKIALEKGAILKREYKQGKGNVVRSMFSDIDAEVYVMIDGDSTYPVKSVLNLIDPILNDEADMVVGNRFGNQSYQKENKRAFHNFGNNLVRVFINFLFRSDLNDIMTGYRAFNKTFVKNIPIISGGFEVETEMTVHALDKRFKIKEVNIDYKDRPEGSVSKLNTFSDGFKVLNTIFWIFKDYHPLKLFGFLSIVVFIIGFIIGLRPIHEFIQHGTVNYFPTAILASGIIIIAIVFFAIGIILHTVVKHHKLNYEISLRHYLLNNK